MDKWYPASGIAVPCFRNCGTRKLEWRCNLGRILQIMNKHNGNDLYIEIIAQAIEEMKEVQGESFLLENVNLAELERVLG